MSSCSRPTWCSSPPSIHLGHNGSVHVVLIVSTARSYQSLSRPCHGSANIALRRGSTSAIHLLLQAARHGLVILNVVYSGSGNHVVVVVVVVRVDVDGLFGMSSGGSRRSVGGISAEVQIGAIEKELDGLLEVVVRELQVLGSALRVGTGDAGEVGDAVVHGGRG